MLRGTNEESDFLAVCGTDLSFININMFNVFKVCDNENTMTSVTF